MASKDEFQWNYREVEPESVLETIPSYQGWVKGQKRTGQYLVELSSVLHQLREAYLSSDQRGRLANHLRMVYLEFQRLAAKRDDVEARTAITQYLALVGSISVTPCLDQAEEGEPFTLLEAIATNAMVAWAQHFYNGSHDIAERDLEGRRVCYRVSTDVLEAERKGRHSLMHHLEQEE